MVWPRPVKGPWSLLLVLLVASCLVAAHRDRKADILLEAKWNSSTFAHEAAEALAQRSNAAFWSYVEAFSLPQDQAATPEECYRAVMSAATSSLPDASNSDLVAVELAARVYSPRADIFAELAHDRPAEAGCCWAVIDGHMVTDVDKLHQAFRGGDVAAQNKTVQPFDHVYPSTTTSPTANHQAIVYGPLGSPCAHTFHAALKPLAASGQIQYIWRPTTVGCPAEEIASPCLRAGSEVVLSGYGVELAIKNMEYNAADDSSSVVPELAATDEDEITRNEVKHSSSDDSVSALEAALAGAGQTTLTKRQLRNLGVYAASRVLSLGASPLRTQVEISQNLPRYAPALPTKDVVPGLLRAITGLHRVVQAGSSLLTVNGRMQAVRDNSPSLLELLDVVRTEQTTHAQLAAEAGLDARTARRALSLRSSAIAADSSPRLRLGSSHGIAWLNDLEQNLRYRMMPRRLDSLLMPTYPGRLPNLRRNLFTAVLFFDPGASLADVAPSIDMILRQNWPVRVGIVPVTSSDADEGVLLLSKVLIGAVSALGTDGSVPWLSDLAAAQEKSQGHITKQGLFDVVVRNWAAWKAQAQHAKQAARAYGVHRNHEDSSDDESDNEEEEQQHNSQLPGLAWTPSDAAQILVNDASKDKVSPSSSGKILKAARALTQSTGISAMLKENARAVLVLNGQVMGIDELGSLPMTVGQLLAREVREVQQDLMNGQLLDTSSTSAEELADKFLELRGGAIPRINPLIFPLGPAASEQLQAAVPMSPSQGIQTPVAARQLTLTGSALGSDARRQAGINYWGAQREARSGGDVSVELGQNYSPASGVVHWNAINPTSRSGLGLLYAALQHYELQAGRSGMAVLFNRAEDDRLAPLEEALWELVVTNAAPASSVADALDLLLALPSSTDFRNLTVDELKTAYGLEWTSSESAENRSARIQAHHNFVRGGLGLSPGETAVVTNGRVLTLEPRSGSNEPVIVAEDYELLEMYARQNQFATSELADLVADEAPSKLDNEALAVISSILASQPLDQKEVAPAGLWARINTTAANTFTLANATAGVAIQAVLDPLSKTAAYLAPMLEFLHDALGLEVTVILNPVRELHELPLKAFYRFVISEITQGYNPPGAHFENLPGDQTLTLGMDVPEPWLVEPVEAVFDLDNVRLAEGDELQARYQLEALMVTGSALDLTSLSSGIRSAEIHPRGIQLELFQEGGRNGVDTLVMSNLGYFQLKAAPGQWTLQLAAGKHVRLDVRKDPARLLDDVLDAEASAGLIPKKNKGLWSSIASAVSPSTQPPSSLSSSSESDDERIHVFTVSSGHMYERLQKIMILSAVKRTSARLKFWFIKNYMSPQMKSFVPIMAKRYDFDYEFITYKWPSWLHKQTEKQRIIWAYKILFLDVLFPLNLTKVIFCDSDQVIRTDLRELWNVDLKGSPYGYTPFCDNNKEMEGFRFWKHGFWKDHLKGSPYHISALYVVDLARFRGIAAGDKLRIIYEQLSKDPNSLANLDQDLPNYAQHLVPIHSLSQDWLWCETWCGEATRTGAKTIDLCNNPLTKEPKLQSARRIIAEWPALDREVLEFTQAVVATHENQTEVDAVLHNETLYTVELRPMVEGIIAEHGGEERRTGEDGHDATEL